MHLKRCLHVCDVDDAILVFGGFLWYFTYVVRGHEMKSKILSRRVTLVTNLTEKLLCLRLLPSAVGRVRSRVVRVQLRDVMERPLAKLTNDVARRCLKNITKYNAHYFF